MSDNLPTTTTSPAAGPTPSPAAPNDPAGAGAQAPSGQQTAISGGASTPGTPAASVQTPSNADAAFEAFLAEANAPVPDNRQQQTTAPAPEQQPATTAQPVDQQPQQPAAETGDENLEQTVAPTAEEQAKGFAPVKNLTRALASRRKAMEQVKDLQSRLDQESRLVNGVLGTFQAAGVEPEALTTFMADLARVRSDPQAQAAVLARLGIQVPQPKPAEPAVNVAEVTRRLEAYDVEGALSVLRGPQPQQPQQAAPAAPAQPPPPAQPQVQAPPQQPQAPQPDLGQEKAQLIHQVQVMSQTLQAMHGPQEAKRLADLIDAAAQARKQELERYGVPVTPKVLSKVYLEAQGKVLQGEQQRRASPSPSSPSPSPTIRPAPVAQPARKLTADEQFEAEFGRRR
jgi:hypothetical protein